MDSPVVKLRKGKHLRILQGHPWIFANEIESEENMEAGAIVTATDSRNKFIGHGYYNPKSQIRVRLLSRQKEEKINQQFFLKRLKQCIEYRNKIGYQKNYRITFGEGDFLPGLILDRFDEVVVLQTLTLGMDRWKKEIVSAINDLLKPAGIYERNDVPVRELEGLPQETGFLSSSFETKFFVDEFGVKLLADVAHGQKTGFFLDQKENRLKLADIAKNAEVLDCFCYTGSFSAFAAHFGAKKITALDISEDAINQAKEVAAKNDFPDKIEFLAANAFDVLPEWVREKKLFDVIILDPPAFTKSRSRTEAASRGYKEINLRAMKLLRPGGFLFTFSCSHFMHTDLFYQTVNEAALDAGKTVREVAFLSQAKDHPVVWNVPETHYLKGVLLQVN